MAAGSYADATQTYLSNLVTSGEIIKKNRKAGAQLSQRDIDWVYKESVKTTVVQMIRIWANDGDIAIYTTKIDEGEDLLTQET